ncbi:MAG: hypothetical protein KBT36_09360 [Kurthia sp.]|nr:hypothetical protein [Candidatus Kurthia equi]
MENTNIFKGIIEDFANSKEKVHCLKEEFTEEFLAEFTKFTNVDMLIAHAPVPLADEMKLGEMKSWKLNHYIRKNSMFKNFDQMLELAVSYNIRLKSMNALIKNVVEQRKEDEKGR